MVKGRLGEKALMRFSKERGIFDQSLPIITF
jgi:hypothetical protein